MEGLSGSVEEVAAVGVPSSGGGPEDLALVLVLRPAATEPSTAAERGPLPSLVTDSCSTAPIHPPLLDIVPPSAASASVVTDVVRDLLEACQRAIRSRLNPLFKVSRVVLRADLPRTASNKVMRRLLRDELVSMGRSQQPVRSRM